MFAYTQIENWNVNYSILAIRREFICCPFVHQQDRQYGKNWVFTKKTTTEQNTQRVWAFDDLSGWKYLCIN